MTPIQQQVKTMDVPPLAEALDLMDTCPMSAAQFNAAVDMARVFASQGSNVQAIMSGLIAVGLATFKNHITEKFQ